MRNMAIGGVVVVAVVVIAAIAVASMPRVSSGLPAPPSPIVESEGVKLRPATGSYCSVDQCVDVGKVSVPKRALPARPGGRIEVDARRCADELELIGPDGRPYGEPRRLQSACRRWVIEVPRRVSRVRDLQLVIRYRGDDKLEGNFFFRVRARETRAAE